MLLSPQTSHFNLALGLKIRLSKLVLYSTITAICPSRRYSAWLYSFPPVGRGNILHRALTYINITLVPQRYGAWTPSLFFLWARVFFFFFFFLAQISLLGVEMGLFRNVKCVLMGNQGRFWRLLLLLLLLHRQERASREKQRHRCQRSGFSVCKQDFGG